MRSIVVLLTKYSALVKAIFYKKRFFNALSTVVSYILKKDRFLALPLFVQIEPTNRCNLNCSLCITGLGKLRRPKRDMSFREFTQIIDQFEESIIYLVLYNLGEPLLNTQLYDMIKYAKKKKIFVRLSSNGYFTEKKHIKDIVNCGLDELIISLDCVSPQNYLKYKNSHSFYDVINNIELIIKERKGKHGPFINVQLLLIRDNEEDISQFRCLVRRLGVDKGLIKKPRVNFPGVIPDTSFLPLNSKYIRKSYKDFNRIRECIRPWISTVILSDGSVVPCCFDMQGEYNFGDTINLNFRQIWNSDRYILFRSQILTDSNHISLCQQCSVKDFFDNFVGRL